MRIMIVSETYTPSVNGAAVATGRLALGLARRGHEVAVVAPSPTGRPFVEGEGPLVTYRTRSMPTPYPEQRSALLTRRGAEALLSAFLPDVVHVQNHFVLGRSLARAARRQSIPVVGTNHFMPENMLPHAPGVLLKVRATRRWVRRQLWQDFVRVYRQLDAVTCPSDAAADLARTQGLEVPIRVVSNGVDVVRFRPAPPVGGPHGEGRARLPIVLYVGRLDPDKGVEVLIAAMPRVRQRHPAVLVLGGRGVQESALHGHAQRRGVSNSVRFAGFVRDEELPDMFRAASVFVMPSTNELQSLATLEAMASGLPVVATDALALPELVEDGKTGFLFPPGDPSALADRIGRLLSDPARAARMGCAAREVAEGHSLDAVLRTFEALYRELLSCRAPG